MTTPTCRSDMKTVFENLKSVETLCENLNNALKDEIEASFGLQEELEKARRHIQILEYAIELLERKLDGHDSV